MHLVLSVLNVKSRNVLFEPEVQGICKGDRRYLEGANAKTAYLEPNNKLLQKPIEGLSALPVFSAKNTRSTQKDRGKGSKKL